MPVSGPSQASLLIQKDVTGMKSPVCIQGNKVRVPLALPNATTQIQPPPGSLLTHIVGPLGNCGGKTGTHLIGPFISSAFLSLKCGRGLPRTVKNSISGSGGSENMKEEERRGSGRLDQGKSTKKVVLRDAMQVVNPESEISIHEKD